MGSKLLRLARGDGDASPKSSNRVNICFYSRFRQMRGFISAFTMRQNRRTFARAARELSCSRALSQARSGLTMTRIYFCKSFDGARIAYASAGRGPAMVEVATWLNHLEYDWKSSVWGPRLTELCEHYTLTRYDGRGCGLSDRDVKNLTFDACLSDLEAVVDAAGLKRFILLGCCQGSWLSNCLCRASSRTRQPSDPVRCFFARTAQARSVAARRRRNRHDAEVDRTWMGS